MLRHNRNRAASLWIGPVMALAILPSMANNVAVSHVTLTPQAGGQARVQFDISWDNSWRDDTNYDACWCFIKYSVDAGATWRHATLSTAGTDPTGFSAGTNTKLEVYVPQDKTGAFIQRNVNGSGSIASSNVQFSWDFAANGVSSNANARVKLLAIEMVYIPQGPFYVGQDDASVANSAPWYVTLINTNNMASTYSSGAGTIADPYLNPSGCGRPGQLGATSTFNAGYPNGFNAFYVMKYELSQGQYTDFLNTLNLDQARNHFFGVWPYRVTITGSFSSVKGTFECPTPSRAVYFLPSFVSFRHGMAYADWAALRPLTEMEYEKAARGPGLPVDNAFVWDTTAVGTFSSLTDDGTEVEAPNPLTANANYTTATPDGPIRCGAFATNNASRADAGASFYGVLDLAGNVTERVVPTGQWRNRAGTPANTTFDGSHGDGELNARGYHTNTNWPFGSKTGPTGSSEYGHRGGSYYNATNMLRMADRAYGANDNDYSYGTGGNGGTRCARSDDR